MLKLYAFLKILYYIRDKTNSRIEITIQVIKFIIYLILIIFYLKLSLIIFKS